jgi:hypothetical protein
VLQESGRKKSRSTLVHTDREGYAANCDAINTADLREEARTIKAPVLVTRARTICRRRRRSDVSWPRRLQARNLSSLPTLHIFRISKSLSNIPGPCSISCLVTDEYSHSVEEQKAICF